MKGKGQQGKGRRDGREAITATEWAEANIRREHMSHGRALHLCRGGVRGCAEWRCTGMTAPSHLPPPRDHWHAHVVDGGWVARLPPPSPWPSGAAPKQATQSQRKEPSRETAGHRLDGLGGTPSPNHKQTELSRRTSTSLCCPMSTTTWIVKHANLSLRFPRIFRHLRRRAQEREFPTGQRENCNA